MTFQDRFKDVDDLIAGLGPIVPTLPGPIQPKLVVFLAVNAVTAYELAIKEIIEDYATSKHEDFGEFVRNAYARINGKIKIKDLKDQLKKFGEKYEYNFTEALNEKKTEVFNEEHVDLFSCYDNLLVCRHFYIHRNNVTLSFDECIKDYNIGKHVLETLAFVMR